MSLRKFYLTLISPKTWFGSSGSISSNGKDAIFVFSTGRTGTKFFAEYFNQYNDIDARHEPPPSRLLRFWSIARIEGVVDDKDMIHVLSKYRQDLISKGDSGRTILESNPFMCGFLPALSKLDGDVRLIHVVRDPRDYVASSINNGSMSGFKGLINRLLPSFFIQKGTYDQHLDPILIMAEFWRIVNEFIEHHSQSLDHYKLVRFEDLFSGNRNDEEMAEICTFIGVEKADSQNIDTKTKINQSTHKRVASWADWDQETAQEFHKICGPLMAKYGYGNEKKWLDLVK